MLIKLNAFKGQNKKVPAHKLPPEIGQSAVNTYIEDDTLRPMLTDATLNMGVVSVPTNSKTVYKHKNVNTGAYEWIFFDDFKRIERHPVGSDTYQRIYCITDNKLKYKKFGSTTYYDALLGLPNPQGQLSVTILPGGTGDANVERFLAYTLVTVNGEESALSLTTSGTGDYAYGNYRITGLTADNSITVTWDSDLIVPAGGTYETISKIRFYMTPTTTSSEEYRFVAETTLTAETITIANAGNDTLLQEEIVSPVRLTYDDYSTVKLQGVCKTSFGSLITWDKATIYVSDQKRPFVFSALSTYTIDSEIVSIHPFGNSYFVTTKDTPYILTGTDPNSMLPEKAQGARGCLNKDCVVDMGNFICIPTDEGIYIVGTGVFQLATAEMFSDRTWKSQILSGAYLHTATQYKNLYLLNLTTGKTLVFDFMNGYFWELDYDVKYGYYDSIEQKLYYRVNSTPSTSLLIFNEGSTFRTYTYKTGKLALTTPVNFKYIKIDAESYTGTIQVKLYDEGVLKYTRSITSGAPVKLPAGLYSDVELEITANVVINEVYISNSIEEILGA